MIYLTEGNTPLNEAYNDEIVQERNNTYQLTFRFPTSDPKWELLKEETFLTADDLHGEQDFYIFEVEKQQGYIQVYANQVISLLNNYIISSIDVDRVSGTRVLSALAGSITRTNPFSFFSDIDDRHTLNIKDKNAMEVLAKDKHSILGQWGGDMVRNGYNLRLLKNGGSENESLFMYKKNLSSYQHKTSTKSLKTRITFKTTVKGEGEKAPDVDYVVVIDSPLLGKYSQIYEAVVEVNDQNVKDQASLIEYGKQYFRTSMCDMLEDNLEISVVGQSDVAVRMFDVVSIYHEWYGLDVRKKITKYTYSPMAKRLKSIGFGTFQSSLANAIGGIVNDAVLNESRNLHKIFEERLKKEIANADRAFDAEFAKREKDITDGIELAKAKAEEVKQELSDTINQRFNSFDNGPLQEVKRKAEEALRNSGASSLLAQEAKQIGLDSIAKLESFKSQATSAQTALSGDLDVLKQTVASEVNQASEYRRTTTEALSRMTGQMNGFATKSEVKQGIDGLIQTFAKMKVGSRNYAEDYDFSRGLWHYNQGDNSSRDWTISNGEYNVKGTTKTWKQFQIHSKEGSQASGKSSTALLDLEVGETYTLSFQGICYSGSSNVWVSLRANRTVPGNPGIINGNFNLTSSWQTYQVTIPALTKPDNFDFWRIILGYNEIGHVAFRKVELTRSSTRIDAGPAPEDGKTDLIAAKSTFERTAQGLRTDLSAIQEYVNKDGQRQEALQRYTREESAKQATAVRELVMKDYVGKATYQEDVRGLERRFEAITNPKNGSIATQIANYKTAVDGRFTDITSLIAGKANQTDFQRVKETSQLYERIIGSNENDISNKVARMALTNQLFQVEVSKNEGLKTVQRQLAGSWSVQNINSAGDIISGINLGATGHNRITGKLTHITGETLIDRAVIKSAMVDKLTTANFEAGSVTTTILDAEAVTADKIRVDQALFNKLFAEEAYVTLLFSKQAFINRISSILIDASQIKTGTLSGDRIRGGTISGSTLTGHTKINIGAYGSFDTVNGGLQINVPRTINSKDGLGVQFIGSYGRGKDVPYGLFIYKDSDFTTGNHASQSDDFLLTVEGYIKAKGIGWLKTGRGTIDGSSTATIGYWNSNNVSLDFGGSGNDIYYSYNGKAYSLWSVVNQHFSDRRLKENIVDCKHKALDYIHQFQFKEYDWKKQEDRPQQAHTKIGLIAQEVQAVDPTLVYENGDTLNLDNLRLTNIALKAIQELALENKTLTQRLENLENERRTA